MYITQHYFINTQIYTINLVIKTCGVRKVILIPCICLNLRENLKSNDSEILVVRVEEALVPLGMR